MRTHVRTHHTSSCSIHIHIHTQLKRVTCAHTHTCALTCVCATHTHPTHHNSSCSIATSIYALYANTTRAHIKGTQQKAHNKRHITKCTSKVTPTPPQCESHTHLQLPDVLPLLPLRPLLQQQLPHDLRRSLSVGRSCRAPAAGANTSKCACVACELGVCVLCACTVSCVLCVSMCVQL